MFGLPFIIEGLHMGWANYELIHIAKKTVAHITAVKSEPTGQYPQIYITVQLIVKDTFYNDFNFATTHTEFSSGDAVEVFYDPFNPAHFLLANNEKIYLPVLFIVLGCCAPFFINFVLKNVKLDPEDDN